MTVSKATSALTVTDAGGKVLMFAPVTSGSARDPLPLGEWKVNGVSLNPPFNYNPDLFWDADPSHSKATLKPGPNNPVGLVWIDLSKEHYGIHGTPEPTTVGKTQSHGCVRLTNWDALKLASLVKAGNESGVHGVTRHDDERDSGARRNRLEDRAKVFTIGAAYGFVAGVFATALLAWQFGDVVGRRPAPSRH